MKLSTEQVDRLRGVLERPGQRVVIVSHTNPDGDAVGSSLAWAEVLRGMGHSVVCVVPNKYPYFLDWMPGIDEVVIFKNDTEGRAVRAVAEADMIFCLDFNSLSRLEILSGTIAANTTAFRVLIDHHLSPDEGFDLAFSYPGASSTCYIVYRLIEALFGTEAITLPMAEALYVGMMTTRATSPSRRSRRGFSGPWPCWSSAASMFRRSTTTSTMPIPRAVRAFSAMRSTARCS